MHETEGDLKAIHAANFAEQAIVVGRLHRESIRALYIMGSGEGISALDALSAWENRCRDAFVMRCDSCGDELGTIPEGKSEMEATCQGECQVTCGGLPPRLYLIDEDGATVTTDPDDADSIRYSIRDRIGGKHTNALVRLRHLLGKHPEPNSQVERERVEVERLRVLEDRIREGQICRCQLCGYLAGIVPAGTREVSDECPSCDIDISWYFRHDGSMSVSSGGCCHDRGAPSDRCRVVNASNEPTCSHRVKCSRCRFVGFPTFVLADGSPSHMVGDMVEQFEACRACHTTKVERV